MKCLVHQKLLVTFSTRTTRWRLLTEERETVSYANFTPKASQKNFLQTRFSDLDLYDLEDILAELKQLEGKNRFQEGDIISKSSNKRVKRKSGKWIKIGIV